MSRKNKRLVIAMTFFIALICVGCGNNPEHEDVHTETETFAFNEEVDALEENVINELENYPVEDSNVEMTVTNEQGNTPTNLYLGGFWTRQGEWFYYNSPDGLARIKTDGTSDREILYDGMCYYMNVVRDWIYFQDNDKALQKVKADGTGESIILDDNACAITVAGDWIYYCGWSDSNEYSLCKIKTDGTGKQELCETTYLSVINVVGDWIYFADKRFVDSAYINGIYKIKTDGSQYQQIYNAQNDDRTVLHMIVEDEDIYYYAQNADIGGLYKIKTDGTGQQLLVEQEREYEKSLGEYFFIVEDNIYFCYFSFVSGLDSWYRMKTDGSELTEATELLPAESQMYNRSTVVTLYDDFVFFSKGASIYRMNIDGTEQILLSE